MRISAEIRGRRDVERMISGVNRSLDEIQDELLAEIAREIVEEQKNLAPVRTGYLRDHIVTYKEQVGDQIIESEAPYSAYVEYGTSRQQPQPFFWPPILAKLGKIKDLAATTINRG